MATFRKKIETSIEHNYDVLAIASDRAKMIRLHDWALAHRADGVHVGIFFAGGTLTIHAPKEIDVHSFRTLIDG